MSQSFIQKQNKTIEITIDGYKRTIDIDSLYNELNYDLATHVFDQFPKVKHQIEQIFIKVNNLRFVTNANPLTYSEIKLLKENNYLK